MPTEAVSPISIALREKRKERGMTQTELAEKAGVRQATISELETGETRRVDLDVLDRLCKALRVEPGELIVRAPTEKASRKGRRTS